MRCFNATLDTPITNACPDIVGVEANSWIIPRKYVKDRVITDAECAFNIISNAIPVYVPGDLPYKPTSNGTNNAYGLQKFIKTTEFFFIENTTLSQTQILQLYNDDWVQVFKDNNGQNLVFGLESGLRFKTSSQDFNSLDTHGGIVVTMEEANVNTPMLFTADATLIWIDYDLIYGGTIANGGAVKLIIDIDKTGYIRLPNGTVLTTVAGVIDTTYTGVGGVITYYVPKNSAENFITSGSTIGNINYNGVNALYATLSSLLTGVTATKSLKVDTSGSENVTSIIDGKCVECYAVGCDLTAKSIGDILYAAYLDSRANVFYDFSGGPNAKSGLNPLNYSGSVKEYLQTAYGLALEDVLPVLVTENSGTIIFNN